MFLYDPGKSRANADKHGIDFEEAQKLWDDENCLALHARRHGEKRKLLLARIDTSHWTAIYTERGSVVRIISVRRSTEKEVHFYECNRVQNDVL